MAKTNVKKNTKAKGKKGGSALNMRLTLIMFAVIPLIVSSLTIGMVLIKESSNEMKNYTHNSLVQVVENVGHSFDTITHRNGEFLMAYSTAPIIKEVLLNPDDPDIQAEAQQYTLDFFEKLNGWEGLYLCDWNSKVITHPAPPVIGKVLREGDSLKQLQDSILAADGVYNTGIMESPASGNIVMSMYYPVMVDGQPLGYVGCATYVSNVAADIIM